MEANHGKFWSAGFAVLLALSFVGYPLVSAVGTAFGVYSRELSIVLRAVVVFLSLGLITSSLLRMSPERWAHGAYWLLFALWLVLLGRFVWDATMVPIPLDLPWFEDLLMIVGIAFLPALALVQLPTARALDEGRRLIVVMGLTAGSLTIYSFAVAALSPDRLVKLARLSTESLNPITTGHLGVTVFIAAVLSVRARDGGRIARLIDSIAFRLASGLVCVVLVVGSNSKGPLLALVSVFLVWIVNRMFNGASTKRTLISLLIMLAAAVSIVAIALAASALLGIGILDRFSSLGSDQSTTDRLMLLDHALMQFERSPFLGDAFVESVSRFYAHNLPADTLMVSGIVGFGLYAAVSLYCLAAVVRLLRTRHSWLSLIYVQCVIGSMFSGSAYFDPLYWCITALLLGVDRQLRPAATEPATTDNVTVLVPAG